MTLARLSVLDQTPVSEGTPPGDALRNPLELARAADADDEDEDEVIVVTITYDHAARVRSYELIADAFGLAPARPVAAVHF